MLKKEIISGQICEQFFHRNFTECFGSGRDPKGALRYFTRNLKKKRVNPTTF